MDCKGEVDYPESNEKYDSSQDFIEPSFYQMGRLVDKYPRLTSENALDQDHPLDNRLAVRILIWKQKNGDLDIRLFKRLVEPYGNGFYLRANGKSTPLWWMKVTGLQKLFGIKKDIAAVRHDYDYYKGKPEKEVADKYYLYSQISLGKNIICSYIEYYALKWFGGDAWDKHDRKRGSNPEYGTDEYIHKLPKYKSCRENLREKLKNEVAEEDNEDARRPETA